MIVSLPVVRSLLAPMSVPLRRRVIVVGATEAGVSAAFHLGEVALLVEQRAISGETHYESAIRRWDPPELGAEYSTRWCESWDQLLHELVGMTCGETRLGSRATEIDTREHRLQLSTGESFIYDKLVSALRLHEVLALISDPKPTNVHATEDWRDWLGTRDIEMVDTSTQLVCGDMDGAAAGKRVALAIGAEMARKYAKKLAPLTRGSALFQPRVVSARQLDC